MLRGLTIIIGIPRRVRLPQRAHKSQLKRGDAGRDQENEILCGRGAEAEAVHFLTAWQRASL